MSTLIGLSIADAATSCAATGGTAQVFNPDGLEVKNGLHLAASAVADFRIRPHITFRNVQPKRLASGKFSNGVRTIIMTDCYLDPVTNEVHYVTTTIEQKYSPVVPASTILSNRLKGAQLMFVAGTSDFNTAGSLS